MVGSINKYSSRTRTLEGFVFKVDPFQDIHVMLTLFLRGEGIVHASAYGARKATASLRPVARLFFYGRFLLDFGRSGIRVVECTAMDDARAVVLGVEQLHIASIWAESICAIHRGKERSDELFFLFDRAYMRLLAAEKNEALLIHVLCMWHMVYLFGVRPEASHDCRYFNKELLEFEAEKTVNSIALSASCVAVLVQCTQHRFEVLVRKQLPQEGLQEAWRLIKIILEATLGYSLKSILVSRALL